MAEDDPVDNPLQGELQSLLTDTRNAADLVPGLSGAAQAVGDGDAWRGALARQTHDDTLGPMASRLSRALTNIVQDVQDAIDEAPDEVDPEAADRIRRELDL